MCINTNWFDSIQSGGRGFALSSRQSCHLGHGYLRPHIILPADHPTRHNSITLWSAVRRQDKFVGKLRRQGKSRAEAWRLRHNQCEQISIPMCAAHGSKEDGLDQQHLENIAVEQSR